MTRPHFLSVDHRGWLWSANEVLRVAAPDGAKAGEWIRLDERDGLSPPWVDEHPFLSDPDGSIWFGTTTGVVHFSPPESLVTRFPPPPVFIAGFSFGQGAPKLADAVGALPHNADVVAHIGSLQFNRRSALHFRYRCFQNNRPGCIQAISISTLASFPGDITDWNCMHN